VTWPSAAVPTWSLCVLTPRQSSGPSGSGLEIRDAYYNGHPVLQRGHAPVVDAVYEGGCGCSRGWSHDESPFEVIAAGGPASGDAGSFAEAVIPPRTACDTGVGDPAGAFRGVAAERLADRLILTTEMSAGAHRYTMSWAFRLDGTIEPRFAFAAAPSGCSSHEHFHHVYWRFELDLAPDAAGPVTADREEMRRVGAGRKPSAGVTDAETRRGYVLIPGPEAFTLPPDSSSVGDVWLLRPKPGEVTDAGSACPMDFTGMLDDEPLSSAHRVIWYRGSVYHKSGGLEECERVGPTLQPVGDWSRLTPR
jgi:hypothetical protein